MATDANAVVDDPNVQPLVRHERPTFHVSRDMVVFAAGVGTVLLILWITAEIKAKHRG